MIVEDGYVYQKPQSDKAKEQLLWHLQNCLSLTLKDKKRQLVTLDNKPIVLEHIGKLIVFVTTHNLGKRFNDDVYISLSLGLLDR